MEFFSLHRKIIMIIISVSFLAFMFLPVLLPVLMGM